MASNALAIPAGVPKTSSMSVLRDKYLSLKNKISSVNAQAGEKIEGVVKTLEIQGAAFLFGAVQGAWYDPAKADDKPGAHILGAPVEAVAGVGLIAAGLFGVGGDKWATHVLNLGNGALAAWSSNLGRGWGFKVRKERDAKKAAKGGKTSGDDIRGEIAALLDE
jgi:hypothetical protein